MYNSNMIFVEAYSGGLIFTGEVLVGVITGSAGSRAGSGSGSSTQKENMKNKFCVSGAYTAPHTSKELTVIQNSQVLTIKTPLTVTYIH